MFGNPFRKPKEVDWPIPIIQSNKDAEEAALQIVNKVSGYSDAVRPMFDALFHLLSDVLQQNARSDDDGVDILADTMRFNGMRVDHTLRERGYPGRKYRIPPGRYQDSVNLIGGCFYCSGCGGMVWDSQIVEQFSHPDIRNLEVNPDDMFMCVCFGNKARW